MYTRFALCALVIVCADAATSFSGTTMPEEKDVTKEVDAITKRTQFGHRVMLGQFAELDVRNNARYALGTPDFQFLKATLSGHKLKITFKVTEISAIYMENLEGFTSLELTPEKGEVEVTKITTADQLIYFEKAGVLVLTVSDYRKLATAVQK